MWRKKKMVLFSGRFDPVHPSHICTIIRLAKKFGAVKVVMLNYKERRFPVDYCLQVFQEIFEEIKLDVRFDVNTIHFGQITRQELIDFDCDIYAAGNHNVLRHIENLGFPAVYVERAYEYYASDIKLPE